MGPGAASRPQGALTGPPQLGESGDMSGWN